MLRYDDINDISDGKLYGADDMVKADTAGCAGCSKCCESDMGDTIVLDPFDIYNMTLATGKSFDELLTSFQVELGMKDTIILPHLKMDKGCTFLNDEKRCSIHKHRPSICRLFPLGRIYNEKGFDYFLQVGECEKEDRTEVRVRDWLGIDDLDGHSAFIMKWHRFIKFEQKKVREITERAENEARRIETISEDDLVTYAGIVGDAERIEESSAAEYRKTKADEFRQGAQENVKEVMKTVLRLFYMDGYDHQADFSQQFDSRMKNCLSELRHIN